MLRSEYRLEYLFFANRGVLFDGVGRSGTEFAKHRCFAVRVASVYSAVNDENYTSYSVDGARAAGGSGVEAVCASAWSCCGHAGARVFGRIG